MEVANRFHEQSEPRLLRPAVKNPTDPGSRDAGADLGEGSCLNPACISRQQAGLRRRELALIGEKIPDNSDRAILRLCGRRYWAWGDASHTVGAH